MRRRGKRTRCAPRLSDARGRERPGEERGGQCDGHVAGLQLNESTMVTDAERSELVPEYQRHRAAKAAVPVAGNDVRSFGAVAGPTIPAFSDPPGAKDALAPRAGVTTPALSGASGDDVAPTDRVQPVEGRDTAPLSGLELAPRDRNVC